MSNIKITVEGLDKVTASLSKFPRQIAKYLQAAGREAASRQVLPTEGLKKYPPATGANRPPTPYYIRGRGTQLKSRNLYNSERLGTQWYVKGVDKYNTELGNRASYAQFVHGERQAANMALKGWKKLTDVVEEKMPQIKEVYRAWIDKLISDLNL